MFKSDSDLDSSPVSKLQYTTIFVCFIMNILDGMDVLIISYCAPSIAKAWGTGPEALGIVFGAGLAGMTLGAMFLAPFADRIGRKKIILLSSILMGVTMYMTAYSQDVIQLMILRFLSGIGIGSMLASTAVLTSEYAPNRTKDFWVSFVLAGYPVGAVLSGLVTAEFIPSQGWERMFQWAGIASLLSIPMIWFFLSESVEFYLKKQPQMALEKANRILSKMKRPILSQLPEKAKPKATVPIKELFELEYRKPTYQLWAAFFLSFATLYFLLSWIPKLASNAGLSLSLAIYAGTVFNVGAIVGIISQGYFSSRFGLKKTIFAYFVLTAVLLLTFKLFTDSDWVLVIFGLIGFGLQGGFVGLYAVAARMYPTEFRTMGVGWAIGSGRLGGVIGPAIGGVLVGIGLSMTTNFIIFAMPILLAGFVTLFISSKEVS